MENDNSQTKIISKSKVSPKCLFIFRVFSLLWMVTHWVLVIYDSGYPDFIGNFFKFMTWWGMQFTIVFFAWALFWGAQQAAFSRHFSSYNHLMFTNNLFVTIFYFAVLYSPKTFSLSEYLSIVNHSMPFVLTLVETLLNNSVFYWYSYFKYFAVYPLYLIFNMAFTLLDEPVYNVMDYESVETVIYILLSIVLSILTHCFGMLIQYIFKRFMFESVNINSVRKSTKGMQPLPSGHEINAAKPTFNVDVENQRVLEDQKNDYQP